uniref:Right handed beta helix domain-containing protein n=1 Tax=Acetithermum autotrophicum TaxID=1446466 RepID=H5SSI3_ACEAU|nr:hypothetical protein HGMM_OP3C274 [Candidatus Acetothermum autotrophicum]
MQRFYLVALAVVFASWTGEALQPQPECTVTLRPEDSIQKAIDAAAPGMVLCLEEGVWDESLLIYKDITIRGAGPDKTVVRSRAMVWTELPITVVIQGLSIAGAVVQGPIRVTFQDTHLEADGIYIIGDATVDFSRANLSVSGFGLVLFGQVKVTLVDSQVDGGGKSLTGIMVLGGAAQLNLVNSRVMNNEIGISAGVGEALLYITLERSLIARNKRAGLSAGGFAHIEIHESTIEGNGADSQTCMICLGSICAICPGIEVSDQAKVVISNSRIANNWDWGVSARLRKCGYARDEFAGAVVFEGENIITGNNRSGKFVGEVCLP